ncbi:MAG TPA: aldehyde dehydrogenase family protein [Armatimonadota bacterium]|nr:aldehyde dehydrogenase family protein [Armatimonadota bacterium]
MKVFGNYINGKWVESASGKTTPNINPADKEEIICEVQASVPEDVDKAMEAASEAFPAWRKTPVPRRAALLQEVLHLMREREDELARAITFENGKTLRESRTEFEAAAKEADFQIGQGRRLGGEHVPSEQPGVTCYLTRQPLGVVSLITPWNFPLNVICRKMFPALVAGNCCVLKPADFTPMTAALLIEAVDKAGFPPGVVNFVTGRGSAIGDVLVCHPAVKAISFTGSTEVGLEIARKVAGSGTKVQLEMGGKNPLVVLADADLEAAVDSAVLGAFSCSGQWCTSTSRAIVEAPVYEAFIEMVCRKAGEIRVGNGMDEAVQMGPVAGPKQYESILNYIAIGKQEGARLCAGGNALCQGKYAKGYFIEPTVFADVASDMRIAREEIFGPVLSVVKAEDFESAIRIANDTIYGLSASIYTNDLAKAQRFIEESEVGLCHVNMSTAWKEPQLEFGGTKQSGRGLPEAGVSGAQFFTEHKAVYIKPQP